MQCRRCQSSLVPVRKVFGSSSEQELFRCTTCGSETMQTRPLAGALRADRVEPNADEQTSRYGNDLDRHDGPNTDALSL